MYKKINITENTLQVLSLFTNDFDRDYYVREVQKLLQISPRTSQLILEDLENKGVLISKYKGKIKSYKINPTEMSKKYLNFVEQYKLIGFLENKLIIKEIIEQISPYIKGIGIIFGSYAKELENESSDLDIFVAGDYDSDKINKISNNLGIEINIKNYPLKLFEQKLKTDILLIEILKNHIIFLNIEEFINLVYKNG